MAELADAADLKSAGLKRLVGVRVPLSAPGLYTFRAQRGIPFVTMVDREVFLGSFDSAALRISSFDVAQDRLCGLPPARGGITPAKRLKKRFLDCALDFAPRH